MSDALPGGPSDSAEQPHRFTFRCTYCRKIIGKPLTGKDLGQPDDQVLQVGRLYRYDRCYCGKGKFVSCEITDLTPDEVEARVSQTMAH